MKAFPSVYAVTIAGALVFGAAGSVFAASLGWSESGAFALPFARVSPLGVNLAPDLAARRSLQPLRPNVLAASRTDRSIYQNVLTLATGQRVMSVGIVVKEAPRRPRPSWPGRRSSRWPSRLRPRPPGQPRTVPRPTFWPALPLRSPTRRWST